MIKEYDARVSRSSVVGLVSVVLGTTPQRRPCPPPLSISSGWNARAPAPTGDPRFPWTLGAGFTVNGVDSPIFIDPAENVVTTVPCKLPVKEIGSDRTAKTITGATGQVYAGIVNGTVIAPVIAPETYQNQPYYPFNLTNFVVEDSIDHASSTSSCLLHRLSLRRLRLGVAVAAGNGCRSDVAVSWDAAAGANHYAWSGEAQGGSGLDGRGSSGHDDVNAHLDTGLTPPTRRSTATTSSRSPARRRDSVQCDGECPDGTLTQRALCRRAWLELGPEDDVQRRVRDIDRQQYDHRTIAVRGSDQLG